MNIFLKNVPTNPHLPYNIHVLGFFFFFFFTLWIVNFSVDSYVENFIGDESTNKFIDQYNFGASIIVFHFMFLQQKKPHRFDAIQN